MRQQQWRWLGAAALLVVLTTACSDDPVSPVAPGAIRGALVADTVVTDFTVASKGGRFTVGKDMKIEFAKHAICDLATSSYGPDQWDAPCTPASEPVRIRAKSWTDAAGHPRVDFSPAMRFVPTETVRLVIADKKAAFDLSARILYCADGAPTCIDESVTDLSLITYRDPISLTVFRRIKHFSGYNVTAGRAVEDVEGISLDAGY